MLRLNNSVAGFLLKQSIDKGKRGSSPQSDESTERNTKQKLNLARRSRQHKQVQSQRPASLVNGEPQPAYFTRQKTLAKLTIPEPESPTHMGTKNSQQLSDLKGSLGSGIKNTQLKFLQQQQELSKMTSFEKNEALLKIYRQGTQHVPIDRRNPGVRAIYEKICEYNPKNQLKLETIKVSRK